MTTLLSRLNIFILISRFVQEMYEVVIVEVFVLFSEHSCWNVLKHCDIL